MDPKFGKLRLEDLDSFVSLVGGPDVVIAANKGEIEIIRHDGKLTLRQNSAIRKVLIVDYGNSATVNHPEPIRILFTLKGYEWKFFKALLDSTEILSRENIFTDWPETKQRQFAQILQRVREKFRDIGIEEYILNERGVGYYIDRDKLTIKVKAMK